MSATNRRPPGRVFTEEEIAQAKEASRQLARLQPPSHQPLKLVTADNHHEMIALPSGSLPLLLNILTQLGQGRSVAASPWIRLYPMPVSAATSV